MRKFILIFVILHISCFVFGQTVFNSDISYGGYAYSAIIIKNDASILRSFDIIENKSSLSHQAFIDSLKAFGNFFITNASIVDQSCKPIGMFVRNGVTNQMINDNDGAGNFFALKPNGAILFLSDGAVICKTPHITDYANVKLGIQSGPMLIDDIYINSNFDTPSKSVSRYIRSGVGTYKKNGENYLIFCISKAPVTFYEFANMFREKFDCEYALCLESQGCVITVSELNQITTIPLNFNYRICNYIYFKF